MAILIVGFLRSAFVEKGLVHPIKDVEHTIRIMFKRVIWWLYNVSHWWLLSGIFFLIVIPLQKAVGVCNFNKKMQKRNGMIVII
jgi:hypothetical protein